MGNCFCKPMVKDNQEKVKNQKEKVKDEEKKVKDEEEKVKDKEEKVKDEEEKIFEQYKIPTAEVEELSNDCLRYRGERCSQKFYTYSSDRENGHNGKSEDFKLMCCKREVSVLVKLSHKNVIKFVGIYCNQKDLQRFPILVTNEVTSNLLNHLNKVETLQDSEKIKFSCGVSDGLAYLHRQQLAHLNLYTRSIQLTEHLEVKIANFEYACYWDKTSASSSSVPTRGNPRDPWGFRDDNCVFKFLPEDCRDDKCWSYDAVDIYSFGCIVINIFTLKQPTEEKESQAEEISIQNIKSIVINCITKKTKSMQDVNETLNICLKKYVEPAPNPVEIKVEIHNNFDESCQNINKETNQGTDGNPKTLKSGTETQDIAVKTGVVQPDAPQTDTDQTVAAKTDAAQTDTDQTVAAKTDAAQTDIDQTVAAKTDAAQTDTDQTVAVLTDAAQTDTDQTVAALTDTAQTETVQLVAVQKDAVMSQELQPYKASNSELPTEDKEEGTGCTETVPVLPQAVRISDDCTSKLNEANKNHESVVARKDLELKEYQERNAKLNEENEVLRSQVEKSEKALNEVKMQDAKRNAELNGENEVLRSQLEESKKTLDKVKTQETIRNAELNEENEVLRSQIEKSKKTLDGVRMQDTERINELEKEKSILISKLTELEEQSFKFTNAFTTADEGSVMKLRDTYRSLQTNGRPAANRAHKKKFKGINYPIAEHTMLAYETAKRLALDEFKAVSEKFYSLFQLKSSADSNTSQEKRSKAMVQSQELLESFHAKPLNEKVYQILIEKYIALTNQGPDGIPQPIKDYYSELAKFTWDCVARTIPMIMSIETRKFDGNIHETKDGDDEDDDDSNKGKSISYIYPVLFTSNSWPREVAMKGKVNFWDSDDVV